MKHELSNIIQSEVADFFAGFVEIHTELGGPNSIEEAQTQLSDRLCALMAAHEQEPVFYIEVEGDDWIQAGRIPDSTFDFNELPDGINKLYTNPASSISDALTAIVERLNLSGYEHDGEGVTPENVAAAVDVLLQQLDDAVQENSVAVWDYFSGLVAAARVRADKAMRKFPQPNYVLNKVAEESGEVIKAVIHYTEGREAWANVEGELIDNLAMLIRLVTEGDQVIGFTPPESCRAAAPKGV